ncbi:MAG TPA: 6-carboxytetrahydropterin synthase QueD [Mucilaginibacter sp.]|jgi:6-pyruvoyltetrahydropterin/6-carboxytetrahydropterin synthase
MSYFNRRFIALFAFLFMVIYKQFSFDSAHFLPNVSDSHKCKQLHGHTYHLTIYAEGEVLEKEGWVLDFSDLKSVVNPIIDRIDHKLLNDIAGLENPTTEILAIWLWKQIKPLMHPLKRIELKETTSSGVIYEGN